jgi:hypothetical protein
MNRLVIRQMRSVRHLVEQEQRTFGVFQHQIVNICHLI